jgi:tetratricopeptide (TPR) repeat protein
MVGKTKKPYKGKSTTSNPAQPKLTKAMVLVQQGLLEEAKILCEDVLKEHPDHFDCLHLLGQIALQRGDYYEAAKLISRAIDIYPKNPAFFYHLGIALHELEELDGAMTAYDLATTLKPDFSEAWFGRGAVLQGLQRFEEAITCYDQSIALKPDYADAYANRGNSLRGLQRYDEALISCDQAIACHLNALAAVTNIEKAS